VAVRAHDPPADERLRRRAAILRCASRREALAGADVAVVATGWPEYRDLGPEELLETMRRPRVVDPTWFLAGPLAGDARLVYLAPGRPWPSERM
jgi:UDP-glucose 6-dehydrogenase